MRFIKGYYLNKEWSNYSNYNIALASTWNEELVYKEDRISECMSEDSSSISKSLENRKISIKVARESIVLLKNENNLLPLKEEKIKKIAIIGERANIHNSIEGKMSEVKSLYEVTTLLGLKMKLGFGTKVKWTKGYSQNPSENERLFNKAIYLAGNSDVVIFVGAEKGCNNKSGLKYKGDLIRELCNVNKNTVVVVSAGLLDQIASWIDKADTVIETWYEGMEFGTALAEVILGEVNPSGKLPVILPKLKNKFPFGYGLSYTTFKYSDLNVSMDEKKVDDYISIKFNLTNSGMVSGAEVCEVYMINKKSPEERSIMNLMGFKKIFLEPDETREVTINLDRKSLTTFSFYNNSWIFEEGEFFILVGSSLEDIRLKDEVSIKSNYKYSWNFSVNI